MQERLARECWICPLVLIAEVRQGPSLCLVIPARVAYDLSYQKHQ